MANFPTLTRSPGNKSHAEELSKEAVQIVCTASGVPVLNKLFTFDPKTFRFILYFVSQADKDSVLTFYNANKDVPFDWANLQDSQTYEVVFMHPPVCQIQGRKYLWRISMTFRQYSPV